MARFADDRYPTLPEVLAWLNNDDLRVMVNWLLVSSWFAATWSAQRRGTSLPCCS